MAHRQDTKPLFEVTGQWDDYPRFQIEVEADQVDENLEPTHWGAVALGMRGVRGEGDTPSQAIIALVEALHGGVRPNSQDSPFS